MYILYIFYIFVLLNLNKNYEIYSITHRHNGNKKPSLRIHHLKEDSTTHHHNIQSNIIFTRKRKERMETKNLL